MVVVTYLSRESDGSKRVTNRLNFPAVGAESVIIIKNAKGKEVVRITRGYVTVKNFNVEEIVQVYTRKADGGSAWERVREYP